MLRSNSPACARCNTCANYTHIDTKGCTIIDFVKRHIGSKTISSKVVNGVTTPSYFISTFFKKKKMITFILALQMTQTPSSSKSKVEISFDVSHLNLAPHMAIMFLVHSLHLAKLIVKINNRGEFKQKSPLNVVRMQRTFLMQNLS
jgi:hypothetical protein